ncbi:hypothetical protein ACROYT_G009711 [Oculina patagonica]
MADPFATSPPESVKGAASEQELASVMELLGAEPESKSKEAIGVQLTHEQVKRLTDKEVEKYFKRYEAYVGTKTTENLIDSALTLSTKLASLFVPMKNIEALQKELKNDYIINSELSNLVGSLSFNYGKLLAPASAALITAKYIDYDSASSSKKQSDLDEITSERQGATEKSSEGTFTE